MIGNEHSTFAWLLESMLERAVLKFEERDYGEPQIYVTYTCVKAR